MRREFIPSSFVVVDVETTGLDCTCHEIIEIGAIRAHRDSQIHATFHALIKPTRKVPRRITEITGITQAELDSNGESIESVLKEFIDFIGDLPLVAYNAEFDMGFLRASARRCKLRIENRATCALKLARRAWPGLQNYKLTTVASAGGLAVSGAHRALRDCEMAMTVYTAAKAELAGL